jgi:hypothetical protein
MGQPTSKKDRKFHHLLATRDAERHLPLLRGMAFSDFPSTPLSSLMIQIDYTKMPEKYNVKPLTKYSDLAAPGFAYAEARTEGLIEKAMENPGKFVLIENMISSGETCSLVLTVLTGNFWDGDSDLISEDESVSGIEEQLNEEDESHDAKATVDEVDLMMGRMMLNNLLKNLGQSERF